MIIKLCVIVILALSIFVSFLNIELFNSSALVYETSLHYAWELESADAASHDGVTKFIPEVIHLQELPDEEL